MPDPVSPTSTTSAPSALRVLTESREPSDGLDVIGIGLVTAGLSGVAFGAIRSGTAGIADPEVWGPIAAGAVLLGSFAAWERQARSPLVPPGLVRNRGFVLAGAVALLVQAAMIGAVFLLIQYFQLVLGYSPLASGLRTMPWTVMPIVVAPLAGVLAERVGVTALITTSAAVQGVALAWFALVATPDVAFGLLIGPMVLAGTAMGIFFALTGRQALDAVPESRHGVASGVNNAMRQLGAVFGVALAAAVFSAAGGYADATTFTTGLTAALWACTSVAVAAIGCAVLGHRVPAPSSVTPSPTP